MLKNHQQTKVSTKEIKRIMQSAAKCLGSSLENKFKLLEKSGEKSSLLQHLYEFLLTIAPTSTVCEQAFSVAGSFEKLNALHRLRYYFKN
jgi:hypothetical protein